MGGQLRLDKYLADMGVGSRSEIKEWVRKGRARINEVVCTKPETKVMLGKDKVMFDHSVIGYTQNQYIMLHKPSGVVSATNDNVSTTVLDLIYDKKCKDLFPVGRLDKDTEGLLLITNDGALAHQLLSPKKHVDKVYYAKVSGAVTQDDQAAFLQGVDIQDEELTLPAKLKIIISGEISEVELTLHEGRFHQVKRMFEAVGKEVIYLKRLSMGSLQLDHSLEPGDYRELTDQELALLKK